LHFSRPTEVKYIEPQNHACNLHQRLGTDQIEL
jgi:hypothetical protein